MSFSAYWLWIWAVKTCNIQREHFEKTNILQFQTCRSDNKFLIGEKTSQKHFDNNKTIYFPNKRQAVVAPQTLVSLRFGTNWFMSVVPVSVRPILNWAKY